VLNSSLAICIQLVYEKAVLKGLKLDLSFEVNRPFRTGETRVVTKLVFGRHEDTQRTVQYANRPKQHPR
jgi:hypothetical protein